MFRPLTRNPLLNDGLKKGSNTGVFQRPDAIGASMPNTCELGLCSSSGGVNLDGWYIARIKRTVGVSYSLNACFGPVAVATSAAFWACAVYQFVFEGGFTRLRRLRYSGEFSVGIGEVPYLKLPSAFIASGNELVLSPEKHYVFATWVGGAAVGVTACQSIAEPAGISSNFYGRTYSASESSDQPVLLIDSSDPGPGLMMSSSKERVLWLAFGTNEDSTFMF